MTAKAMLRNATKASLRRAFAVGGRALRAGRGPATAPRVLCYHGVCDDPPDEWSVTPAHLRAQMELVRDEYIPVTIDDVVAWHLGDASLPERAVAVTFDDGYLDVLDTAAPIMADLGVPGAAFVVSDVASGGAPDSSYVVTRPVMTWEHIIELASAGWTIGSHSLTHPQFADHSEDDVRRQLIASRDEIEQRLGATVDLLAYPYGTASTVSPRDHKLAERAGYRAAFMDTTGVLSRSSPTWALPRSKVLGTDSLRIVRSSLRGDLDLWRHVESRRPAA